MNWLLDSLGYLGETLDKPGAAVRGLLAGRPDQLLNLVPFSDTMGLTDPSQRTYGRDLLEKAGVLDANQEGFDWGDVAGFGVDLATDPLNWVGLGMAGRTAKTAGAARASNATREAMLAQRAMPEEISALTRAIDEAGNPLRTYHGTRYSFGDYDLAKMSPDSLYGPGIYTTANPEVASTYAAKISDAELPADNLRRALGDAEQRMSRYMDDFTKASNPLARENAKASVELYGQQAAALRKQLAAAEKSLPPVSPNVRMHYIDARNPFDADALLGGGALSDLDAAAGVNLFGSQDVSFAPGSFAFKMLEQQLGGPKAAYEALRKAGYDSITHMGGGLQGGGDIMHQVWIATDPSQVYAPYIAPALRDVPRVSPILAALAGQNLGVLGGRLQ